MLISQLEVRQEGGVKKEGTRRMLRVPVLISLFEVCQEWVVKKEGNWRMMRVPDWRHGEQGHP